MAELAPTEYLYELWDAGWDGPLDWQIRRHPIIKKTPKRIFYADRYGRTFSIDRQKIEADGVIWSRVQQRRLHLAPPEIPDHTKRPSLPELRQAMADAHPDRGGTDAAFIAARARYETARARAT